MYFLQVRFFIKNNPATDINAIFNYINSSKQKPFVLRFDQICLSGMTEDVRLGVFVHRDDVIETNGKPSHQKIVFVSDENT